MELKGEERGWEEGRLWRERHGEGSGGVLTPVLLVVNINTNHSVIQLLIPETSVCTVHVPKWPYLITHHCIGCHCRCWRSCSSEGLHCPSEAQQTKESDL